MNLFLTNFLQIKPQSVPGKRSLTRVFALLAAAVVLLSACAGDEEVYDLQSNIRDAYTEAQEAVDVGNYRKAISIFEALQARFPFSEFSTQIQLELAYAYYKDNRVDQAIDEFIEGRRLDWTIRQSSRQEERNGIQIGFPQDLQKPSDLMRRIPHLFPNDLSLEQKVSFKIGQRSCALDEGIRFVEKADDSDTLAIHSPVSHNPPTFPQIECKPDSELQSLCR